jgi:DNA-binding transcriptional regulator YhcF (GntR family)
MKSINIDLDSDTPAYRQIATEIRAAIARGELRQGEALPGVRDIADRLGLNLNTVAKAYRVLAEEGLVELRQGASAIISLPSKKSALAPDTLRTLRDVLGQWVMSGISRKTAERELTRVLDELYTKEKAS